MPIISRGQKARRSWVSVGGKAPCRHMLAEREREFLLASIMKGFHTEHKLSGSSSLLFERMTQTPSQQNQAYIGHITTSSHTSAPRDGRKHQASDQQDSGHEGTDAACGYQPDAHAPSNRSEYATQTDQPTTSRPQASSLVSSFMKAPGEHRLPKHVHFSESVSIQLRSQTPFATMLVVKPSPTSQA